MEIKISKEVKIGILMVLTIGFFIWGYSFLRGKNLLKPTDNYFVVYDQVGGLMESGHVFMSGYKVGYVDDIRFMDDIQNLIVKISIDKRIILPEGTMARIFSSDIMGTKAVELVPGISAERHHSGDTLIADIKPDLQEEITRQIEPLKNRAIDMMASLDSVMGIFKVILDEDFRESFSKSMDDISGTVSSLQRSMYTMDTLLTKEDSRFNRILANLGSISGNVAASNEDITIILNNFAAISDSLAKSELLSAVNHLNDVLAGASEGEGSLGKFISDEQLYNNLESASENLDKLLIDLRERPGRYVNFSIFGRKRD